MGRNSAMRRKPLEPSILARASEVACAESCRLTLLTAIKIGLLSALNSVCWIDSTGAKTVFKMT